MSILLGMARLARGRGDGMAEFGSTESAFLASLAPLLAFSIVGSAIYLTVETPLAAAGLLLVSVISQLAPPVLSHALARRWDREEDWLRYATAFNWCQVLLPFVLLAMLAGVQAAALLGVPPVPLQKMALVGALGYMLWLSWVVARHGLDLSRLRAAAMVALVTAGTYGLAAIPSLILSVF